MKKEIECLLVEGVPSAKHIDHKAIYNGLNIWFIFLYLDMTLIFCNLDLYMTLIF